MAMFAAMTYLLDHTRVNPILTEICAAHVQSEMVKCVYFRAPQVCVPSIYLVAYSIDSYTLICIPFPPRHYKGRKNDIPWLLTLCT
jgi:hypothetical protein